MPRARCSRWAGEHRQKVAEAAPRPALTTAVSADPWERDHLRTFDFGVIPEGVDVVRQGVRLRLHPTLIDHGSSVSTALVADTALAERGLRTGLVRLWVLGLSGPVRHAEKAVLSDRDLCLLHQGIGSAQTLAKHIAERAVLRECLPADEPAPRTVARFDDCQRRGQATLVTAAERLAGQVKLALGDWRAARQELSKLPEGCDATLVADLRRQLDGLIFDGFVAATPEPWLEGIGRYLKALRRRIAKLPGMRGAVADAQHDYFAARRRYEEAALRAHRMGADPAVLVEWRWHLEEYAVQLFAQDLRTRVPVSAKRLAAIEAVVTQGLARL